MCLVSSLSTVCVNSEHIYSSKSPPGLKDFVKAVNKPILKKMLQMCTQGHFSFNKKIYKQIDGVQMGSPLGPIFAN